MIKIREKENKTCCIYYFLVILFGIRLSDFEFALCPQKLAVQYS